MSQAHILLQELRERTRQETLNLRQKLLQEKEEAVTQAKIEAQFSSMAKLVLYPCLYELEGRARRVVGRAQVYPFDVFCF